MKNTQIENMYVYIGVSFIGRKGEFFFREREYFLSLLGEGMKGREVWPFMRRGKRRKKGRKPFLGQVWGYEFCVRVFLVFKFFSTQYIWNYFGAFQEIHSPLTILPLGYGSKFCFWAKENFFYVLTIRTLFLVSIKIENN